MCLAEYRRAAEGSRNELKENMRTIQLLQAKLHEREAIVLARQEKASSADREVSSATAAASQMNSRLHKAEAELHALRSSHQATQDRLLRSEACVKMLGAELRAYRLFPHVWIRLCGNKRGNQLTTEQETMQLRSDITR